LAREDLPPKTFPDHSNFEPEMFFVVGLGLGDEKDVTVKGLEAIKGSERVYLEAYTSVLGVGQERLEEFYGKKLIIADREMVSLICHKKIFLRNETLSFKFQFTRFTHLKLKCANLTTTNIFVPRSNPTQTKSLTKQPRWMSPSWLLVTHMEPQRTQTLSSGRSKREFQLKSFTMPPS
jgi:hypothetical protein